MFSYRLVIMANANITRTYLKHAISYWRFYDIVNGTAPKKEGVFEPQRIKTIPIIVSNQFKLVQNL